MSQTCLKCKAHQVISYLNQGNARLQFLFQLRGSRPYVCWFL